MMTIATKMFAFIAMLALAANGLAQEQEVAVIDDFEPFGTVDATYAAYDVEARGAIVLSHTTPGDQHANFDVVGPDDYFEHFDFSDDPGEELVLDDLLPGVYSIAATDEGLELVHTVVEVRAGESVAVHADLDIWEEGGYLPGTYDPYTGYAVADRDTYRGYPGYPYGAYNVGDATPYTGQAGFGAIAIDARDENIDTVVTGPNGYSEEFEGDAIATGLWPGVYAVASTEQGFDLAVTTVEVEMDSQIDVSPTLVEVQAQTE